MGNYRSDGEFDAPLNQQGIVAASMKLRYHEFFHIKSLYRYMHEWLINEGWGTHDDHLWQENFFLSSQHADGEQIIFWWRMNKRGENKETPFIKKVMDLNVHIAKMKNVEKIIKGQKVKGNHARCDFNINGRLIVDPDHTWENHFLLKHFKEVYWKRFNKRYFDHTKMVVYREVYQFHSAIKNFFSLYRSEPERRPMKPIKGVPQSLE